MNVTPATTSDERRVGRWLVLLLTIHIAMLAYGAWIHGPGWDEAGHLPAGISHWQLGNTDLYRVNPPLVRMVATIPLAPFDYDLDWSWDSSDTYARPEWKMGVELWQTHGMDVYWYLTIARWMSIPWSVLAAYVVFIWSRKLYGSRAGLLSAVLWCFSPLVLTNAQVITPDVAAAALGVCAALAFWNWLQNPDLSSTYFTGLLLGLTELTKTTWIILFGLWPLLWILRVCRSAGWRSFPSLRRQGALLAVLLVVSVFVINLGYGFEGTFTRLGDYRFVSSTLRGPDSTLHDRGNRFADTALGQIPVPLPRNYVLGIDRQKLDFELEIKSYLRGQWRDRGWWYYYAYGLLIKEPVGFIVLFGIVLAISTRRRWRWEEVFLLAPAIVVFGFVSSQTGFNHHLRYVLPCFPFVFIWMGNVYEWANQQRWRSRLVLLLLGSSVASSVWVFPHSHAYFNSLVGGPIHGHDHLLDSNIDWGQDILLVSNWARDHPDKPLDSMAYSLDWLIDNAVLGLPAEEPPKGYPEGLVVTDEDQANFGPQPGRYAVFVRPLREADQRYAYFRAFEPTEILGYTVHIYELDEEDVANYWKDRTAVNTD
jgi:hypothetical protein